MLWMNDPFMYVGVIWFVLHVLQLPPMAYTEQKF